MRHVKAILPRLGESVWILQITDLLLRRTVAPSEAGDAGMAESRQSFDRIARILPQRLVKSETLISHLGVIIGPRGCPDVRVPEHRLGCLDSQLLAHLCSGSVPDHVCSSRLSDCHTCQLPDSICRRRARQQPATVPDHPSGAGKPRLDLAVEP